MRENLKKSVKCFILIYFIAFAIFNTSEISRCILISLKRCVLNVIPSLFAMMVISGIIIKSGLADIIARFINPIARIFRMNGNIFVILIISMIGGYPIGAKMISEGLQNGSISKKEAKYTAVCFGSGTAFIFGCVSDVLFSESNAGVIILISTVSVNFIMAVIISFFSYEKRKIKKVDFCFNSEMLVTSVVSAGKNMFSICTMIMFFSVFTCVLNHSGILYYISQFVSDFTNLNPDNCQGIIESLLEVTNITELEKNNYTLLPFVSFAVSFGGVCVILQIKTVNNSINLKIFTAVRFICAVLSGILCRIIMPFVLENQVLSVSNMKYRLYSSESPVPSYMLAIMIIILLCSFREKNRHQ